MTDFSNLDLETIKEDIKNYLKDNSSLLADYNYEGSGVSSLIDLLAYVTQYQMFNLNMVTKELYLSSALLTNSVYRLANMLNYTPKRNSAPHCEAVLTNTGMSGNINIVTGATFSSDGIVLTYIGDTDITLLPSSSVTISLSEGQIITNSFLSDGKPFQTYELVDREKISNEYLLVRTNEDYYSQINTSNPVQGQRYYYVDYMDKMTIKFDNGVMFTKPNVGETVVVSYLKTEGGFYNKAIVAGTSLNSDIPKLNAITSTDLINGSDYETIDEIKSRAVLFYTTQNRAITENDYNILATNYPAYSSLAGIVIWGGEQEYVDTNYNPVEISSLSYADTGFVYVSSLKKGDDIYAPSYLTVLDKNDIDTYFAPYKFMTIKLKYVDPTVLYILPSFRIKLKTMVNQDPVSLKVDIDKHILDNYTGFDKIFSKSNVMEYVSNKSVIEYLDFDFDYYIKVNKGSETYSSFSLNGAIDNVNTYYISTGTLAKQVTSNSLIKTGTYSAKVIDNGGHVGGHPSILSIVIPSGMTFSSGATVSLNYTDDTIVTATITNINKLHLNGTMLSVTNTQGTVSVIGTVNPITGFVIIDDYGTSLIGGANSFGMYFKYSDEVKIEAKKKLFIQPEPTEIAYL
jgi:hypothetical protein